MKKLFFRITHHPITPFIVFFLLIAISYGFTLTYHEFVSDDVWIVEMLPKASWSFFFPSDNVFHLQTFVLFILYKLFGIHVWLFRLNNILFHFANASLFYLILLNLTKKRTAVIAATLFSIHPLLTESVTWVAGGIYAMYSFFFLSSFFLYIKAVQYDIKSHVSRSVSTKTSFFFLGSFLLFCVTLLFNEKAVSLFLLFPLYEWAFGNIKKRWTLTIPYALVSILLTGYYFFILSMNFIPGMPQLTSNFTDYSRSVSWTLVSITRYLELFIWPQILTFYHVDYEVNHIEFVIRMVVLVLVAAGVVMTAIKSKKLFFWVAWFFVSLALTLSPVNFGWVMAERYIYLPSIGFLTIIAMGISSLSYKNRWKRVVLIFLGIAIVCLTVRTIVRNKDWESFYTFSFSQVKTSPNCPYSWNNIGDYYTQIGNFASASANFRKAVEVAPWFWPAWSNLGNSLLNEEKPDDAITAFRQILTYDTRNFDAHMDIANILINQGKNDEARVHVLDALEIQPDNENAKGFLNILDGKELICE